MCCSNNQIVVLLISFQNQSKTQSDNLDYENDFRQVSWPNPLILIIALLIIAGERPMYTHHEYYS